MRLSLGKSIVLLLAIILFVPYFYYLTVVGNPFLQPVTPLATYMLCIQILGIVMLIITGMILLVLAGEFIRDHW